MPGAVTRNRIIIKAPRERVYRAFLDPQDLLVWLPPGEMTGVFHAFDAREGGGYCMSLFYPGSEGEARGKTSKFEDQVMVRFVELTPPERIVEAVTFVSCDPAFAGEMTLTATFAATEAGAEVTLLCENLPAGVRPEDNEAGGQSSLENLARHLE